MKVIQYKDLDMKRGSLNRIWLVLGAFAHADKPIPLVEISRMTGMTSGACKDTVKRIEKGQFLGLTILRDGKFLSINHWGGLFEKKSFQNFHKTINKTSK